MRFEISFRGHQNMRSTHARTIEITRDAELTPRGDCIVGVRASHACRDIPQPLRQRLQDPNAVIRFCLVVNDAEFSFRARGSRGLTLDHPEDVVIRTSSFECPRTLAIGADKASSSIPRHMVRYLQDPSATGRLIIEA